MSVVPAANRNSPSASPAGHKSPRTSLALQFAKLVTVKDEESDSLVHRFGKYSLFGVLNVCSQGVVCSERHESRHRLTISQLNKLLEKDEFFKVRNRYVPAGVDQDYIGSYSFGNRRWRDPCDPVDFAALFNGYMAMREVYEQSGSFSFANEEVFIETVRAARENTVSLRRLQQAFPHPVSGSKHSPGLGEAQIVKRLRLSGPLDASSPQDRHAIAEWEGLNKLTAPMLQEDPFTCADAFHCDEGIFSHLLPVSCFGDGTTFAAHVPRDL